MTKEDDWGVFNLSYTMRKIIGIGETIFDILFKNNQPYKGEPGGSMFNAMISLGRMGLNPSYISEIGRDRIGRLIFDFMQDNGVQTAQMYQYYEGKSPISLAFINEGKEPQYDFYMSYPTDRLDIVWPRIDSDDIILFGSFYSLNAALRPALIDLLNYARERNALIFYDPNFRKEHTDQALWLSAQIIENLEFASLVRGSVSDFQNMYKEIDVNKIYLDHIKFYCPNFICTDSANGIYLKTNRVDKFYRIEPAVMPISTVGAGDSFNAGIIYGLLCNHVSLEQLPELEEDIWDKVINMGILFASHVCQSNDNYISREFASEIKKQYSF